MFFGDWKENLSTIVAKCGGVWKIVKLPMIVEGPYRYIFEGDIPYKNNKIRVEQCIDAGEIQVEPVAADIFSLKAQFPTCKKIYLYLGRRDGWDKLWPSKIKIGNDIFDKNFRVKSSSPELARAIFSQENIVALFMNNQYLQLSIVTHKKNVYITIKDLRRHIAYSDKDLHLLLLCMQGIIDAILNEYRNDL